MRHWPRLFSVGLSGPGQDTIELKNKTLMYGLSTKLWPRYTHNEFLLRQRCFVLPVRLSCFLCGYVSLKIKDNPIFSRFKRRLALPSVPECCTETPGFLHLLLWLVTHLGNEFFVFVECWMLVKRGDHQFIRSAGKVTNPEWQRSEIPHSCGDMCGKKRSGVNCNHPCNMWATGVLCLDSVSSVDEQHDKDQRS